MAPRKLYTFYIDADLAEGLKKLKDPETSEGALVRRALREFMVRQGVIKAVRKRAVPRKRS